MVAFYDGISVDERKDADVTHLKYLTKQGDTVPHSPSLSVVKIRIWWINCLMDEEMAERSYTECAGQWLNVWTETDDK